MRSYISTALAFTFFTASVSAFALPEASALISSDTCVTDCTPIYAMSAKCGWSLTSGSDPTSAQVVCLCSNKSFAQGYKVCANCVMENGGMTSQQYKTYTDAVTNGCAIIENGAQGASPACAGQLIAGMVVAGLGYYGL